MNALDELSPLERTWMLSKLLPNLIPEAVEGNEMWGIGHIDPETFVLMNCSEDRLEDWENIDPILNQLLGYGATQGEIAAKVHCSKDGVEGVVGGIFV